MKSDAEIVQMIRQFRESKAILSDEELDHLCDVLEHEVPGLMHILMARERHASEEALRLAKHQRRVFVVGEGGPKISHPDRPLGPKSEE